MELETLSFIVLASFMVMIWSFLYRENKFYRFAEFTIVGIAVSNAVVVAIGTLSKFVSTEIIRAANPIMILPIVIGLLLFTRYSPRWTWLARYPVGMLVGIGTGLILRTTLESDVVRQIESTLAALTKPNLDSVVLFVSMVFSLSYFFYTFGQGPGTSGKAIRQSARIGRLFLMLLFGALYGAAIFTRISHVAAQMFVILAPKTLYLATPIIIVAILAIAADSLILQKRKK
ncbi:MAG: hypothetical protein V1857_04860 [archaeon]